MTKNVAGKTDLLFPPDAPLHCTLTVKNFLTLKDISCDFCGVNVIIGPQAEGKSLIAKLLYFFYTVFAAEIYWGAVHKYDLSNVNISSELLFKSIFPKYSWKDDIFTITFSIGKYSIVIKNKKTFNVTFSDAIIKDYSMVQERFVANNDIKDGMFEHLPSLYKIVSTYIPDSRILFSKVLQKNIFNLIESSAKSEQSLAIDILLRRFSAKIENRKAKFSTTENFNSEDHSVAPNITDAQFMPILKGAYRIIGGNDYIVNNDKKTLLEHTSSGQQVATPMLLAIPNEIERFRHNFICLEEPEAHLFPTAQKQVMEHIVAAYNNNGQDDIFCITTHSPYLLSTLNNCITAAEVLEAKRKAKIKNVEKILPRRYWIPFEDVRCYYLEGGRVTNLMNPESRLIDTNAIDAASDTILDEFSQLVRLVG